MLANVPTVFPGLARAILRYRWRAAALLGFITLLISAPPAVAGFTVCNQTLDVANVAIGREERGVFRTQGWWTVGSNQCANVIKGDLGTQFVYVYAEDVFGRALLSGATSMCVGAGRFLLEGTDSCWQRGEKAADFLEVDTRSELNWTLFLAEPGQ